MTTTLPKGITDEDLAEIFAQLPKDELVEMTEAVQAIEKQLDEDGPNTDDELWQWIWQNLKIKVPRVAVCEGHQAPFDFIAAAYFNRFPAILAMANRGGGKTFLVALLHWLNSQFKPGYESCSFGATEAQSLRCYAHLKNWVTDDEGNRLPQIVTTKMRETVWRSNSKVEVLAGTPEAVNGPHTQTAHADEVELMRQDTWDESRNIATSKTVPNSDPDEPPIVYPSQEILTSTRKSLHGRMQSLIDGIQEAKKLGTIPDYELIVWCIFEIAAEVPTCQAVHYKTREKRLKELGRDPCEKCDCHLHMKGKWPDTQEPRYLKDVCKGRLFRARGYMPYSDIVQKFKQNSIFTWEAQQECTKPETEFNYLKGFADEQHGVREYKPKPEYGEIFQSTDWGGTNPHAANWYQLLAIDLEAIDFYGNEIRLIEGTLVCFDEIYVAEIGVTELAKRVKHKEREYRRQYPGWKVKSRFADPQGKMARLDFKDAGLPTIWKTTRDFDEQTEWLIRDWWEPGLLRHSVENCPMYSAEAQSWQRDPKTGKQIDEFNHCMSNLRYCTANIRSIRRRKSSSTSRPIARGRHRTATVVKDTRRMVSGPVVVRERGPVDNWRKRLGGPGL